MRGGFGACVGGLFAASLVLTGCSLFFAYPEEGEETRCDDGVDDDDDGRVDCYDSDCSRSAACEEICDNSIDDDGDGQFDCADDFCASFEGCDEESGASECNNEVDDDRDGVTDCDDPGCDGFCSEVTAGECSDGRDNDGGDAWEDGADPRCWLALPSRSQRCASVIGSTFTALSGQRVVDPETLYSTGTPFSLRSLAGLGEVAVVPEGNTLGTIEPLAGAWDGSSFEVLVEGRVELLLALASATGVDTPAFAARSFFRAAITESDLVLETVGDARTLPLGARDGWQLLRITVDEGQLQATLLPLPQSGTGETLQLNGPAVSGEIPASRLLVTGPGLLSQLRVEMGTSAPCGVTVPPLDNPAIDTGLDVGVARDDSGRACGLSVGCNPTTGGGIQGTALFSMSSTDGLAWRVAESPIRGVLDPVGVAVAWDAQFHAAVLNASGEIRLLRSEDCVAWTEVEATGLPVVDIPETLRQPECAELVQRGSIERTLSYVVEAGMHGVLWTEGSGEATRFMRAQAESGTLEFRPAAPYGPPLGRGSMISLTRFAGDEVVTRLVDPAEGELGIRVELLDDGELRRVPGPAFLAPSGVAGSYDRDALRSVALLAGRPLSGGAELVIGALGDFALDSSEDRGVRVGAGQLRFTVEDEE